MVDTQVSIAPAPASTADIYIATAIPLVMCECTWIGTFTFLTNAEISTFAAAGVRIPAISLIQIESTPMDTCSLASVTNFSTV